MKKAILLVVLFLTAGIFLNAQDITTLSKDRNQNKGMKATKLSQTHQTMYVKNKPYAKSDREDNSSTEVYKQQTKDNNQKYEKGAAVGTKVGETTYDLQTNNSVGRRVFLGKDGTVHCSWTRSLAYSLEAPDRGTGYNYIDTNGDPGPFPESRLEADRTGWPDILETESGRLVVIAHYAGSSAQFGGLSMSYKDPGDTEWTHLSDFGIKNEQDTWVRTAVSGNTIHVICGRQSGGADPQQTCDLTGGINYYVSYDAGDNWELGAEEGCIPGLDPEHFPYSSGDGYSIDANGDVVAIAIGPFQPTVFKSTDAGKTWEMYVAETLFNPLYSGQEDEYLPQTEASDECYSVLVDNDGKVHVWYGLTLIQDDFNETGQEEWRSAGWSVYPSFCGIMYWNDGMEESKVIGKTVMQDMDGDSTGAWGWARAYSGYFGSQVSHPSAGIDENGNLYVVYSAITETNRDSLVLPNPRNNYIEENMAVHFKDIFAIKSTDGGQTWVGPLNVTNGDMEENVFASMAREVRDGKMHFIYQSDALAGMAVQGPVRTSASDNNPKGLHTQFTLNEIMYVALDVDDIVDPTSDYVTAPLVNFGSARYGFENCPYDPANIEVVALDYPDGSLEDLMLELSGSMLTGPEENGYYPVNVPGDTYELVVTLTDSEGVSSSATFGNPDNGNGMVIVADGATPVILGNPTYVGEDGFVTSFFPVFDTIQVVQGEPYNDMGAEVFDVESLNNNPFFLDEHCRAELIVNNPLEGGTDTPGWYEITYTAIDINGNEAEPVTRWVQVIGEDTEAPEIILLNTMLEQTLPDLDIAEDGSTLTYGPLQTIWEDPGFLAFDNVDGDISDKVVVEIKNSNGDVVSEINLYDVNTYTITYCVTDNAGNETCATRNVEVKDTEPPVLILSGTNIKVWSDCIDYVDQGFESVYDEVDGSVSADDVVMCGCVNPYCEGEYTLTFYVCDNADNVATVERKVIVPPLGAGCEEDCTECCNRCIDITDPCNIVMLQPEEDCIIDVEK